MGMFFIIILVIILLLVSRKYKVVEKLGREKKTVYFFENCDFRFMSNILLFIINLKLL
jgi:EamA domain-containing membrane protein RarD